MIIAKVGHWCPECRLYYDEWEIPSSSNTKITLGGTWPVGINVPETIKQKCKPCKHDMLGRIHIRHDEKSSLIFLVGIEEIS